MYEYQYMDFTQRGVMHFEDNHYASDTIVTDDEEDLVSLDQCNGRSRYEKRYKTENNTKKQKSEHRPSLTQVADKTSNNEILSKCKHDHVCSNFTKHDSDIHSNYGNQYDVKAQTNNDEQHQFDGNGPESQLNYLLDEHGSLGETDKCSMLVCCRTKRNKRDKGRGKDKSRKEKIPFDHSENDKHHGNDTDKVVFSQYSLDDLPHHSNFLESKRTESFHHLDITPGSNRCHENDTDKALFVSSLNSSGDITQANNHLDKRTQYSSENKCSYIETSIPKITSNNDPHCLELNLSEYPNDVEGTELQHFDEIDGDCTVSHHHKSNSEGQDQLELEIESFNPSFKIDMNSVKTCSLQTEKLDSDTYKNIPELPNSKTPRYSFLEECNVSSTEETCNIQPVKERNNTELSEITNVKYVPRNTDYSNSVKDIRKGDNWNNVRYCCTDFPRGIIDLDSSQMDSHLPHLNKSAGENFSSNYQNRCLGLTTVDRQYKERSTDMDYTETIKSYEVINIGEKYSITDYVKKEWKGNTDKAQLIRKGYEYIPFLLTLSDIRLIRGDNYCALRSTLFQILTNKIPLETHIGSLNDCLMEVEKFQQEEHSFLQGWNFAGRIQYDKFNVHKTVVECVETLYQQLKACKHHNSVQNYLVQLLNMNPEIDLQLLEAVKCLMMLKALQFYQDYQKGLDVPIFVWLLFARDTSDTPDNFLHHHMNKIGDTGGMEQIEMFLLGYTLGVKIKVVRPYRYDEDDFITHFPDENEFPSVNLIAEDDRHYNVLV